MELGPLATSRGVRFLALDEIDSTNDEAARLIRQGEGGPLWITARRQSKGRGRLGREWISAEGNLAASFILSGFAAQRLAPQLGFVAGVAAVDALRDLTSAGDRLTLKWPNDILLDGGKLSGLLLECTAIPTGDPREPTAPVATIGIGINCASAPRDLPYETAALADLGPAAPGAAEVFAALSDRLVEALDLWAGGAGFPTIRRLWLDRAAGLGRKIGIVLAQERIEGVFQTIDDQGRLVVQAEDGERVVEAGDVTIARAGAP